MEKVSKSIKLNAFQNGYLDFLYFSILTPKTQNFDFKNSLFKSKFIYITMECVLSRYMHTTRMQNFKAISLFLVVKWPKNQVRLMTTLFWNAILGISNCHSWKWMMFLESWDKTGQDRHVLVSKFWIWIWPLLT